MLPGVRFACDAYVELVRESPLVDAVASSLTEFFAPDIMSKRIAAWEQHYPWVDAEALGYFKVRVTRARADGDEALAYVVANATSRALQEACVAALVRKTEILWHLLDCVHAATVTGAGAGDAVIARGQPPAAREQGAAARRSRARASTCCSIPERGLELTETAARIAEALRPGAHGGGHRRRSSPRPTPTPTTQRIEDEVLTFLRSLDERGLLVDDGRGRRRVSPEAATEAPRPYTLVAELTYRCPLACGYCSNPLELDKHARELDTAAWKRVLGEAAALGVLQVNLTGGEPLVRDDLEELVAAARAHELYVNLITSGVPLDARAPRAPQGRRPRQPAALRAGHGRRGRPLDRGARLPRPPSSRSRRRRARSGCR